jgi:excisionase family DNA binding protein
VNLELELPEDVIERIAERAAALLVERQARASSPWLAARAAASHLCCSVGGIHDLVGLRKLEPHRDGRRLLFKRADLDAYLEEQG